MDQDDKAQLLVGLVALLGREEVEAGGGLLGVAFEQVGPVAFEFGQPLAALGESA